MYTTTLQPFPDMPLDILREVFEFASTSSRETALALTLVSSVARHWTLPIIYRDVSLSSSRAVSSFLTSITPAAGPGTHLDPYVPLHRRVKNLGIFALGPISSIQEIISACTDIQTLACGFSLHSYSHHLSLQDPPIRPHANGGPTEKHFLGCACRDGIPFPLISANTTHLHLQISMDVFPSVSSILEHLPALTHLALSVPATSSASLEVVQLALAGLLEANSALKVLFMQIMGSRSDEVVKALEECYKGRMETEDCRAHERLVLSKAPISVVRQWGYTLAPVGGGLWEDAEREIHSRRRDGNEKRMMTLKGRTV